MKESSKNKVNSITYNPENVLKYIKLMEKIDINKVYSTKVNYK